MVTGYHGTAISVEPKTKEGLYIVDCDDASITISKKCAKAGIEACQNLSVYFNAPVMTEMCELVSSQNLDIYISREVTLRTITIDMCSNVNIHVQNAADQLFKIYYHQSSDTRLVKHEGGPVQRIELDTLPANNDKQRLQFVCRVHDDGQIQIDPVVREGKGYPTTEEEKAEHEANELIMLRHFRDQIYLLAGLDDIANGEMSDQGSSGSANNSPP
jgi:hypothetical protein